MIHLYFYLHVINNIFHKHTLDMIANKVCYAEMAIIISHPTSVNGKIIVLFIKDNQEILLHVDLADFTLQEQPEDN